MNTIPAPAGAEPAGSSTRSPRRQYSGARRRNAQARRRRLVSAAQAHAVPAAAIRPGSAAPPLPPARFYVRTNVLEPAEVQTLLAACSPASRTGVRDRALIAAGYWGCVRPIEALHLTVDALDAPAATLTVTGRNGTRAVELPPEAVAMLSQWAAKRRRLHKPRVGTGLFCTLVDGHRPGPITLRAIDDAVARAARAAGITKPVGLDALRAARAKELALAGAELADLAALLDHWRMKTRAEDGGRGMRPNLDQTRRLVTELAPHAACVGHFTRPRAAITLSEYWGSGRVPANKGMELPPEPLTPDEVRAMLRAVSKRGTFGPRNAAIIIVLWRAGLRVAEAVDLEHRDIDLKNGVITVRKGKGNKRRVVGIDPRAVAVIARWLEVRDVELGLPRRGKVFCTISLPMRGGPLSTNNVREMLKTLAKRAGIDKRVHPHGLRHTHAFELSQEGVPLTIIQKQLGHNDLATTARYIDHLMPEQVVAAMQAREWAFTR
jgi:site-specific recombinase XerD